MADTSIEWTDAVWNPVRGCTRVSDGCRNCYAERFLARDLPGLKSPTTGESFARSTKAGPRWTGKVELIPSKLDEPLRWRKPRRVFVNSVSDLFHEALADEQIAAVFGAMLLAEQHTFQILTKRPERARRWFEWIESNPFHLGGREPGPDAPIRKNWPLPNVWLGVSVEDQATADERIPLLLQTPAAVRWVSYEPALGPVSFRTLLRPPGPPDPPMVRGRRPAFETGPWLDWVVVGGESGPGARPFDLAWARLTVQQCRESGVPVFVKQLGARPHVGPDCIRLMFDHHKAGDPAEWPEDLRVREFPAPSLWLRGGGSLDLELKMPGGRQHRGTAVAPRIERGDWT